MTGSRLNRRVTDSGRPARRRVALGLALTLGAGLVAAGDRGAGPQSAPGVGVTGLVDELRQLYRLDLLPRYRTGSVVAQESSYDRKGGNDDGFNGTYSSIRKEATGLVLADLEGPGVVHRIWTPTPTDRPLAFYFDGEDRPRLRLPFADLFSGAVEPFVKPVVGNEVGGYYCYLPLPYAASLKIVYEGDDMRFHQIQYRRYPAGTRVRSFQMPLSADETRELQAVVSTWTTGRPDLTAGGAVETISRRFIVKPGETTELFARTRGGRIVGFEIERDAAAMQWPDTVILKARWDGAKQPAILSPVADFFGYAFGEPSARSLLLGSRGAVDYCYLPMPFDRSATLSLTSAARTAPPVSGTVRVFVQPAPRRAASEGRLYALWRREANPPDGQPYTFLDVTGRGHYVGTLLQAQGLKPGMTEFFEGDDEATIDGELRLHGTGSEDYFNGGWYALLDRWDRAVSLPIHGSLAYDLPLARTGGYRFYLADKISFERQFRLTIEHGPEGNHVPVDYTSVAFYYGESSPGARLDPTKIVSVARRPTTQVFYPQLMSLALGSRTVASYADGRAIEISAAGNGLVRIDVGVVPPGRYKVRLSYERGPGGAEFSVWRRQLQVSAWTDSFAPSRLSVDLADMGDVELTDQTRSITIRTRPTGDRRSLRFTRLVLERLDASR